MDLALGVAFAGYHFFRLHRQKSQTIQPSSSTSDSISTQAAPSYLLDLPAEIRLVIYDFVFPPTGTTSSWSLDAEDPSTFLLPLLTCRQIHEEAYPLALQRAHFSLLLRISKPPFWTPRVLYLPSKKARHVKKVTVLWDSPLLPIPSLHRLFVELSCLPLELETLTFTITNPHCLAPFRFKYASLFPGVRDFGVYVLEQLPLLDNVGKIVFEGMGVEGKRTFQHLFDPAKPRIVMERDAAHGPSLGIVRKKLGDWNYVVVREGTDVRRWSVELVNSKKERKGR